MMIPGDKKWITEGVKEVLLKKDNYNFPIIDAHVHPLDVMGVVHPSECAGFARKTAKGEKNSSIAQKYFTPSLLEKLGHGFFVKKFSSLYYTIFSGDVMATIKKFYGDIGGDRLLEEMDICGVDYAALLPVAPWVTCEQIEVFYKSDRFLKFCSIDFQKISTSEIQGYLIEMKARGILGVKLHPNLQNFLPQPSSNPPELAEKLMIFYRSAQENKLILLFHGGQSFFTESVNVGYNDLQRSHTNALLGNFVQKDGDSEIFNNYKMPIIIAHLGHFGIQKYDIDLMKKITLRYSNIYFDTTGVTVGNIKNVLANISSERIIFGSDALYNHMAFGIASVYYATRTLVGARADEALGNILGRNFKKLIALTQ